MHGKQGLAEMRRRLQIGQDVIQEEVGIGEGAVSVTFAWSGCRLPIVKDDNLIDAKNCARPCNLSGQAGLEFVRDRAVSR